MILTIVSFQLDKHSSDHFFYHGHYKAVIYTVPHPVKDGQHHVELLLLLLLGHMTWWVAQLREEPTEVHEAQRVVLRAALVLPRPPHDPLHHVHLQRLLQAKAGPVTQAKREAIIICVFNAYNLISVDSLTYHK